MKNKQKRKKKNRKMPTDYLFTDIKINRTLFFFFKVKLETFVGGSSTSKLGIHGNDHQGW